MRANIDLYRYNYVDITRCEQFIVCFCSLLVEQCRAVRQCLNKCFL